MGTETPIPVNKPYNPQQPQRQLRANDIQIGGSHYKDFSKMEPWDIVNYYNLGYFDGNAVKYLLRWRHKHSGIEYKLEDLKKARHYIDKLIELMTESMKEEEALNRGG